MADRNKVTISICVPSEVDEFLKRSSKELKISKSSLATAMLTIIYKWARNIDIKEVITPWQEKEE